MAQQLGWRIRDTAIPGLNPYTGFFLTILNGDFFEVLAISFRGFGFRVFLEFRVRLWDR